MQSSKCDVRLCFSEDKKCFGDTTTTNESVSQSVVKKKRNEEIAMKEFLSCLTVDKDMTDV